MALPLRTLSLAWRIFFATLLLMPLLLGFSAFMLERAFTDSLRNAERELLLANTYSMMALAEPVEGFLLLPEKLPDTRFNDPGSGLYAQVVDDEYGPVWESISLTVSEFAGEMPNRKVPVGDFFFGSTAVDAQKFFVSRYNTVWDIDGQDREYQFTIIHAKTEFTHEVNRYRITLLAWLGGMALLLILLQTLIVKFGLRPLQRLASEIKRMERGELSELNDAVPREIQPVTENINFLLQSEHQQRARYKNTLGDLAHSLKTPLAVIRAVLSRYRNNDTPAWPEEIDSQVERMNAIVSHQLARAETAKASYLSLTPLAPLVTRISQALNKVYATKNMQFTMRVPESLSYPAQEADLMECLGNVLENAFKYGKTCVAVETEESDTQIVCRIDDDGEGVPEQQRGIILQRGARLDTHTQGQGIGLAVALDILSGYGGGIKIESSPLGGARFELVLPKHEK